MWAKHVTRRASVAHGRQYRSYGAFLATARAPGSSHVTDKKMNPTDLAQEAIGPATVGGFSFLELSCMPTSSCSSSWPGCSSRRSGRGRSSSRSSSPSAAHASNPTASNTCSGRASRSTSSTRRCRAPSPSPWRRLFVAAMREWKRSVEGNIRALGGIQLRVEKVMDVTISREMERLDRRLLFLATVGSTAPFVGLFGTVWGIMTSFQAIAVSKNTNLAVVAPGIAEALFATALGLLAAIPAVIFYNKFSADRRADQPPAGDVRRRVRRHRVAADRRQNLMTALGARRRQAHGAASGQRQGGGRRSRARTHAPMSEINVTPMVDVMLVLLIIFMVAAPLLQVGVPIELPQAKGKQLRIQQGAARHQRQGGRQRLHRRDRGRSSTRSRPSSRPSPRTATTSRSSCAATRASPTARSCASWDASAPAASARCRWSRKWRMEAKLCIAGS